MMGLNLLRCLDLQAAKARAALTKGGKKKAKGSESEEEDDDFDSEDDDDDFEPVKPKPVAAKKPAAPKPMAIAAAPAAPKPAAPKPKPSTSSQGAVPVVAPKPVAAPEKPQESEPLSLAARLAGRFQQLTVKPVASGSVSTAAQPPPAAEAKQAISAYQFDDDDITSPAPVAAKTKSKVFGAGLSCKAFSQASK